MRRWSNGYDCGLPSRLSGFETAFLHKAKNLGKCGELLFGRSPRILLRKIKEAGESPSRRILINFIYGLNFLFLMVRILYGVAGEGFGHAVRSRVLIEQLNKKNKIKIVTSGKGHSYLKKLFDVEEIDYFRLIYRNNKISILLTLLNNLIKFPIIIVKSLKISKIIQDFRPNIIITDFEPLVAYFAFFKKIPLISVDNQHVLTKGHHKDVARAHYFDALITNFVIRSFIIKPHKHFINSFFDCKLKDKDSILVKPLLREEIINAHTSNKGHILVYQTSKSNKKLIKELQKINKKFIVYGFPRSKKIGNITFKNISEKGFLKDLSSCSGVITNAGSTLMSEALFLKKPILSLPVKRQFEQILNAIYLEKLGYGMFARQTKKEIIEEFIRNIPKFRNKLKNYKKYDNNKTIRKISDALKPLN